MTLGVPVVAASRGSLPEVLDDAGLLVDPEDADAMADAIGRLLADDRLARACAVATASGMPLYAGPKRFSTPGPKCSTMAEA